ncbi:MAG: hypothetical protein WAW11_00620 [Patescibacteria group bacterium]
MNDLSNYQDLKENAQKIYNNINKVFSPIFDETVVFKAEGFNHIVFRNPRLERERSSQILRFRLIKLAEKLVGLSTTYQEFEENIKEFIVKKNKKRVKRNQIVKYWGIIAIIDGQKIKVIIRKIGDNGFLHFWSIIPAWTTNKNRDIKFFTTMRGSPEED